MGNLVRSGYMAREASRENKLELAPCRRSGIRLILRSRSDVYELLAYVQCHIADNIESLL